MLIKLLVIQLTAAKQTISLLQQDKDFFSRQVTDLHNKLLYTEERAVQSAEQLEKAKQAREELYDKYVASKLESYHLILLCNLACLAKCEV